MGKQLQAAFEAYVNINRNGTALLFCKRRGERTQAGFEPTNEMACQQRKTLSQEVTLKTGLYKIL